MQSPNAQYPVFSRLARALVASLLALPGTIQAAGAPEPQPEAVVAEIPFEPSPEPGRVFVNLAKEGHRPFVMLLDTGASHSVVTPRMARALGVSVRALKSSPYKRATRLGRDLDFRVDTSGSDTAARGGWEYGILGGTFLAHYVVEIDFPGRRVRFLDPERYEVPDSVDAPGQAVVPFRRSGTRIGSEIEIDGRRLRLLLDTGSPVGVILSGRAARKLSVDVDRLPDLTSFGTVLGEMPVRVHEAEHVSYGGFRFEQFPILVAPRGWYNQGGSNDSVVGYDLLRPFVIRIDYARRRLWLGRKQRLLSTYMGVDYGLVRASGLFVHPQRGDFFVVGVLPGSPAARLGVRPNDVLVAPGDEPLDLTEMLRRIERGDPVTVARLENDVWIDRVLPDPASQR